MQNRRRTLKNPHTYFGGHVQCWRRMHREKGGKQGSEDIMWRTELYTALVLRIPSAVGKWSNYWVASLV